MPARSSDPFRPPDDDAPALELAPRKPPARTEAATVEEQRPPEVLRAREPVAYKKPGGGWVTMVFLAFTILGVLAAATFVAKKLKGAAEKPPAARNAPRPPPKPVVWKALPTDDAVLVTIQVSPRGARLLLDGEPLPSNPVRLPRGGEHSLTATADGHEPAAETFTADGARTVKLTLRRAPR